MASDAARLDPPSQAAPVLAARRTGTWTTRDLATGCALVAFLISLFLPWFTLTLRQGPGPAVSTTGTGPAVHGYLWFAFALAIVALAALVGREAVGRGRANLPSASQVLIGVTIANLVLTILAVVVRPPGGSFTASAPTAEQAISHLATSVGWSYGGFVALAAAAAALVAAVEVTGPLRSAGATEGRSASRAARRTTLRARPRQRSAAAENGLAAIGFDADGPVARGEDAGPASEAGPARG